jgi:hypothetical protein
MFFAAMIRYPICIQSVLRILSDGPSLELCNSSQGVGSLTPMRQCLLRRLSRHHEPKPAFVAGTRERKEIRSLVDNLESGSSQFLFHEVRPDFVVLHLLRSCGRADIVVEWP